MQKKYDSVLILAFLLTAFSASAQANVFAVFDTSLMLSNTDQAITLLIAGFNLSLVIYNGIIFCCTREKIYLHFSVALLFFIIGIGQWGALWLVSPWPRTSNILIIDTLNLMLFLSFIKHFLILLVDFKNKHPRLCCMLDMYTLIGGLLIIGCLLFSPPVLLQLKSFIIIASCLSCMLTIPFWYATLKHLRIFLVTQLLFGMTNIYLHAQLFFNHDIPISLFACNIYFLSASLLCLSFSLLLGERINNDRKQRDIAQNFAIHNLKKYQLLYQNALEGLFTVQEDGRLLKSNPALNQLLNLPTPLHANDTPTLYLYSYFLQTHSAWHDFMQQLAQKKIIYSVDVQGHDDIWYSLSLHHVAEEGNQLFEGSLVCITQRKQQEQQLTYLASHDALTDLYNRSEFENHLQDAIGSQGIHTLLFVDLDQFKVINDTCGHAAGDECLQQISAIFKQHIGKQDMLARLGGDEFGIVLWNQAQAEGMAIAERMRQALEANHFQWLQRVFKTTISTGLICLNNDIDCGAHALSLADAACYEAKEAGRNRIVVNAPNKQATVYRHSQMNMVATLTQALKDHHLVLFQQGITPLSQAHLSHLCYYEVLVRLKTEQGLVYPGAFLPAAQRYNMLSQIDRWVFSRTCQWLAEDQNLPYTRLVNVNLSPQTLSDHSFIIFIEETLARYQIPAQTICFEITEYSAFNNFTRILHHMYTLKSMGFSFALDDFGSGFASFDHVKRLPVDTIKIDGQFIRTINRDVNNKIMVASITKIAHNLGKKVIAEWIEDAETAETLHELGVDFGQGYFLGKPKALYAYPPIAIAVNH